MEYCSDADVYGLGVPAGSIPNPARLIAAVDTTADTFTLDGHGLEQDQAVKVRAKAGGVLPNPLLSGTHYYVLVIDDSMFQLAASSGGVAINITTEGSNVLLVTAAPMQLARAFASRLLDELIPAHAVPFLSPVPDIIRYTAAELAAAKLTGRAGTGSKSLMGMVDDAKRRVAEWAKGLPVRGATAADVPATNLALSGGAAAQACEPHRRFGGLA